MVKVLDSQLMSCACHLVITCPFPKATFSTALCDSRSAGKSRPVWLGREMSPRRFLAHFNDSQKSGKWRQCTCAITTLLRFTGECFKSLRHQYTSVDPTCLKPPMLLQKELGIYPAVNFWRALDINPIREQPLTPHLTRQVAFTSSYSTCHLIWYTLQTVKIKARYKPWRNGLQF